ncbi:MAG: carboxypeptidase-like regulatory domain-containing protein [Longimicrobiales bacterium]
MRRVGGRLAACIVLAVVAAACDLTGPDPSDVVIEGVVIDEADEPVEDALVRVAIGLDGAGGELASTESASDGAFAVSYRRPDEGTPYLLVSKEGYTTAGANLSQISGRAFLTVTLEADAGGNAAGGSAYRLPPTTYRLPPLACRRRRLHHTPGRFR